MERKKRMLILGSGISGLTVAWELTKQGHECLVLEKEHRPGGCIYTEELEGNLMEKGPRMFRTSHGEHLLALIEEMGLSPSLQFSHAKAPRYLLAEGRLKPIPMRPLSCLTSSLGRQLLRSLWRERNIPPYLGEESVEEFGQRRFGSDMAETLWDAFVTGIYGGDLQTLSMEACFPRIKAMEQAYGSVVRGIFALAKQKKDSSMFTLEKGMGSLVQALVEKIQGPILYGKKVTSCKQRGTRWEVMTPFESFEGDELILALPAYEVANLLTPFSQEVANLLTSIPYQSMTVANVVFAEPVLSLKGLGYLIPHKEKESLLGVLFDTGLCSSKIATRLTMLLRGVDHPNLQELLRDYLRRHLHIQCLPKRVSQREMPKALPQYPLHHKKNMQRVLELLPRNLYLAGNYLEGGISVNGCIQQAKETASRLR
ncbi:MAG: protoporphyrinogen oxidase [Chlamydiae bacterium]|nr:protoporphyrinogen oxidase [Chlamydiota bacterium]